jgi:ADP-heptose:LPS heptosyltransferase
MKFWFQYGVWKSRRAARTIRRISRDRIESIAVIRHSALGDMVLTRSFLVEARRAFPNARITLCLVSHYTRGAPTDLADRVHVVHGKDQRNASLWSRFRRIRELGRHDLIFDLAATNRSFFTCLLTPSMMKIGFPYRAWQARLFYDVAVCRSDLNFEVCDMLNMLHLFGVKTAYPHRYDMPGEPLRRARPYVVYFAGASNRAKCWPTGHFTRLIGRMAADYPGHDHLVLEGIQEWEKADAILAPLWDIRNAAAIRADTVEEATALIKGADLVVSNDTGIRHLAIVSETPTVGLFFSSPFRYWPRYDIHDVALPETESVTGVETAHAACVRMLGRTGVARGA